MYMSKTNSNINEIMVISPLEALVPKDHLVRKLDKYVDWSFIYDIVAPLYSNKGRGWTDPVVLFKMMFINKIFGINSMRKTCDEVQVNVAYRWFLNIGFDDKVPDHSTYSQNYRRKYKDANVAEAIFANILMQLQDNKLIDVQSVFIDGTHIKANANKNKYKKCDINKAARHYQAELDNDINEIRASEGKKELKEVEPKVLKSNTKVSTSDSESGLFHKGEKERCFAYNANTACDKNGYILGTYVLAGNIHDSQSFYGIYNHLLENFNSKIKYVVADAGYITPHICKQILDNKQTPIMPYKRPMTKRGYFKKYEYVYDEGFDCYICPNDKLLEYKTTNREGYREYKSNPVECRECPYLSKCTQGKTKTKLITRHIWESYKEEVCDHIRHTDEWKMIYPKRKETIERVFADGKSKHGMGFTRYKGRKKVADDVLLICAAMNMKKMVMYLSRKGASPSEIIRNIQKMITEMYLREEILKYK